jgi:hypothetical protein
MNLIPYVVDETPRGENLGIQAREFLRTKQLIEEILARHTGQPVEKVHQDTDRDRYMDPEEARAYGMIDAIFTARPQVGAAVAERSPALIAVACRDAPTARWRTATCGISIAAWRSWAWSGWDCSVTRWPRG